MKKARPAKHYAMVTQIRPEDWGKDKRKALKTVILAVAVILNCHIYLYMIGIVTSNTFGVYTFWLLVCFQLFDCIEASWWKMFKFLWG